MNCTPLFSFVFPILGVLGDFADLLRALRSAPHVSFDLDIPPTLKILN